MFRLPTSLPPFRNNFGQSSYFPIDIIQYKTAYHSLIIKINNTELEAKLKLSSAKKNFLKTFKKLKIFKYTKYGNKWFNLSKFKTSPGYHELYIDIAINF